MIVADGVSIKNSDTRHKYGSAMAEYMDYLCGMAAQDRDTGGGDGFMFYAQFGKRIMTCDEQGFVDVITFANEDDANSAFREADEAYWAWCADGDEAKSVEMFEVVAELTIDTTDAEWHAYYDSKPTA